MNILVKSTVALMLLMGIGATNAATVTSTVIDGDTTFVAGHFGKDLSDSSNVYTFDIGALSNFNSIATYLTTKSNNFSSLYLTLFSGTTQIASSLDPLNPGEYVKLGNSKSLNWSVSNLVAGTYSILVSGQTNGKSGGLYSLNGTISAVPEPETYALMGVGLLGLLAARRRKAMES
nr:FxDxF family PEP-CTERM protein [uncultured Tolumonas sp.]